MFIDISSWNSTSPAVFNFDKAKANGVIGAYIRATFGLNVDGKFSANKQNCNLANYGAYSYFDYRGNGADQCKKFLDTVGTWGNMRGVLDLEDNSGNGWPRLDSMYGTALSRALAWVNQYKLDTGHYPVMYLNSGLCRQKDWMGKYIFRNFLVCALWVAHYTTAAAPITGAWSEAALWQYSSTGDGLRYGNSVGNTYIDLNRVFNLPALMKPGITPEDEIIPIDMTNVMNIEPLSQVDASRGDIAFGTTKIRYDGCVIVNIEMMAKYLGLDIDTARLVDWLKANGGLYGNLFVWKSIENLIPGLTFTAKYAGGALDKIDESLSRKMPCLVHVDFNPATSVIDQHWVLVIGKSGSSYIINDPKDGKLVRFEDRYGDPLTNIYNVSTYNFTSPIVTDAQKLERLWNAHTELH